MKFDSLYGVRDGDFVKAEAQFTTEKDSTRVSITLRLGPPVEFVFGNYSANIGVESSEGTVSCDSLSFFGGQATVPSLGGVFVLKNSMGRPLYRISIPPTPVKRRKT